MMVRGLALWAGAVGLAVMASAPTSVGQVGHGADSSIRATLSLMPAQPWSEASDGFSAFDLKAMRSYLDLDWPDQGQAEGDDAWPAAIAQVMDHVVPPPRSLMPWVVGDLYDYYAALGLNPVAISGAAEMHGRGQARLSVLVGDGLAEASALTAAIGPGATVGGIDGSAFWDARDMGGGALLFNDRLLAFSPDIVIAHHGDLDPAAVANAAAGSAPSLAQEPIVEALLQAVDGAAQDGTLVSLFAMHPDHVGSLLGLDGDGWPADAALPAYDMVAFGLRFDADIATSMIALIYQHDVGARAAEAALDEMRGRLPFASSQIDMPVDDTALVEATPDWSAIIVSSTMPIADLRQRDGATAYAAWLQYMVRLVDLRLIGPDTP